MASRSQPDNAFATAFPKALVERLETRRLLAVAVDAGVATITGGDTADTVAIARDGTTLVFEVDGNFTRVDADGVTSINIRTGDGDDTVNVESSIDLPIDARLGSGDDVYRGGSGPDIVFAGDGNDTIFGSAGDDQLRGEAGDDALDGGWGRDSLWGHDGDDALDGGHNDDRLFGGDGPDIVRGGEGTDNLLGVGGHDTLIGGTGDAYAEGNDGDDLIRGDDEGGLSSGRLVAMGGDGNDTLRGGERDDDLHGGPGDDELVGGPGDDRLDGSEGNDDLRGETGSDTFVRSTSSGGRQDASGGDRLLTVENPTDVFRLGVETSGRPGAQAVIRGGFLRSLGTTLADAVDAAQSRFSSESTARVVVTFVIDDWPTETEVAFRQTDGGDLVTVVPAIARLRPEVIGRDAHYRIEVRAKGNGTIASQTWVYETLRFELAPPQPVSLPAGSVSRPFFEYVIERADETIDRLENAGAPSEVIEPVRDARESVEETVQIIDDAVVRGEPTPALRPVSSSDAPPRDPIDIELELLEQMDAYLVDLLTSIADDETTLPDDAEQGLANRVREGIRDILQSLPSGPTVFEQIDGFNDMATFVGYGTALGQLLVPGVGAPAAGVTVAVTEVVTTVTSATGFVLITAAEAVDRALGLDSYDATGGASLAIDLAIAGVFKAGEKVWGLWPDEPASVADEWFDALAGFVGLTDADLDVNGKPQAKWFDDLSRWESSVGGGFEGPFPPIPGPRPTPTPTPTPGPGPQRPTSPTPQTPLPEPPPTPTPTPPTPEPGPVPPTGPDGSLFPPFFPTPQPPIDVEDVIATPDDALAVGGLWAGSYDLEYDTVIDLSVYSGPQKLIALSGSGTIAFNLDDASRNAQGFTTVPVSMTGLSGHDTGFFNLSVNGQVASDRFRLETSVLTSSGMTAVLQAVSEDGMQGAILVPVRIQSTVIDEDGVITGESNTIELPVRFSGTINNGTANLFFSGLGDLNATGDVTLTRQ
ncbi:MAG: calcium-binding protein [Planctomycetota bacterium]